MKSIIRNLSAPTEFCLIIFICFGLTIFANSVWIIRHLSHVPPTPANSVVRLNNDGIIVSIILELLTLGIALLIGRIRGWSLTTFGLRPSWNWTGAGVLLFFAFLLVQRILGLLTRMVFHSTVDFHRVSHLTIPFIILTSITNPIFEETLESGYFFKSLQRHGMWFTVLAAAFFRGFLHTTMGASGFIAMFAMGVLYGLVYWRWRQLWSLVVAHSLQMLYSLLPQALAT